MGVFGNTGQMCIAGSRVFVERPVYEELLSKLSTFADSLRVGNSLDPQTQIGPIVSRGQLARVTGYLDVGKSEGARATAGGARLVEGELANGYFVASTVFADAHDDMRIIQEEIFGPVACVMPFDTIDKVIERADRTPFGLGAGVWTRDVGKVHRMTRSIRAGTVWANTYGVVDPALPFGGMKMSGCCNDLGMHSLDDYLYVKAVWIGTE